MAAHAQVSTESDRFTGQTTFTTHLKAELNKPLRPMVRATIKKDGSFEGGMVILSGAYHGWQYLRCHDTHWLLDGKPISLITEMHDGSVMDGGYVSDLIAQPMTLADLRKFAAAQKVEFEVCHDAGEFTPSEMQDLRDLVARLK
jgi:hypothetical protein